MTKKYPKLTVNNVIHWYWECDPAWSIPDIAQHIKCPKSTVHLFMEKNGIDRRDHSEAALNALQCPSKKENVLNARRSTNTRQKMGEAMEKRWSNPESRKPLQKAAKNKSNNPEFSRKMSEILKNAYQDPIKRQNMLQKYNNPDYVRKITEPLRKFNKKNVGITQINVLTALYPNISLFLNDFLNSSSLKGMKKSAIESSVKRLFNRGFILKTRKFNENSNYNQKSNYYSLSVKGFNLISDILQNSELRQNLEKRYKQPEYKTVKVKDLQKQANKVGKTQIKILKGLYPNRSLFVSDFKNFPLTIGLTRNSIETTLKRLYIRGYVKRVKKKNENGSYKGMVFNYSLTPLGFEYIQNSVK